MTIESSETGICPHCKTANRFEDVWCGTLGKRLTSFNLKGINDYEYTMNMCRCTNCKNIIIFYDDAMIYPLGATRPTCPQEVDEKIANDYKEACLVEPYSKKAAAALSRRCLQNMLHEQGITKKDLNEEINEAINKLPTHLGQAIDAIRVIGNFATHPIKYTNTGEIVEVEDEEAEWSLNVLEQLFDFFYVSPKKLNEQREKLNQKLQDSGKPTLK